jgi:hypothetical protein
MLSDLEQGAPESGGVLGRDDRERHD